VLVAGAGGGFDVYAAPDLRAIRLLGKEVFLANLSFVSLEHQRASVDNPLSFSIDPRRREPTSIQSARSLSFSLGGAGRHGLRF